MILQIILELRGALIRGLFGEGEVFGKRQTGNGKRSGKIF